MFGQTRSVRDIDIPGQRTNVLKKNNCVTISMILSNHVLMSHFTVLYPLGLLADGLII